MSEPNRSNRRPGVLAVHSIHHFALTVPDLAQAQSFFDAFGLATRATDGRLELRAADEAPVAKLSEGAGRKRLNHLAFSAFDDDLPRFEQHARQLGAISRPAFGIDDDSGVWLRSPDGLPVCIRSGPKTTPDSKVPLVVAPSPANTMVAPMRGQAPQTRPARLSHLALFTSNLDSSLRFYQDVLGLRLSDRSDVIAFLHGPHGSDHHLIALIQSNGPGLHHSSWAVPSLEAIGVGAMQAADRGYTAGWGLGRHVLGSNYFHYVRDPWGSFAEYSADIDYISADSNWTATHHAPENSFYLWGPTPPADFVENFESQR